MWPRDYRIQFALGEREARFELKIEPDYEQVLQYLGTVRRQLADALGEVEFVCGYEAGCLGDTLYHQVTAKGIKCGPPPFWNPGARGG